MCRVEQQRFQSEMDKLQHALEAKEAQMQRVVNGTGQVSALKQHYDRVLMDLAGERDVLQADRTRLLQVCCKHSQVDRPKPFIECHASAYPKQLFTCLVRHKCLLSPEWG